MLTQPELVRGIHHAFLAAGADIIESNTFGANAIAQADYALEAVVYDLNYAGAQIARQVADEWSDRTPDTPRFVAGAMGPTNRMLSLSPHVDDRELRALAHDDMRQAFAAQARALIEGGVDLLQPETFTDTLNAKACLHGIADVFAELGVELPIVLSVTITDEGRTLSGQTMEALWTTVEHAKPWAVGMNCAFGARAMRPHIEALSRVATSLVSVYPNAGLPNAQGDYDETPELISAVIGAFARSGFVNIVGGCCGTTPAHVRAIADAVRDVPPRAPPAKNSA